MPLEHLESLFPNLREEGYHETSSQDRRYNCFAWSVYDTSQWWEKIHIKGYYWPLERDDRLQDWVRALELNNYARTDSGDFENGYEKVAIYAIENEPQHVARQLPSGRWTSKIGRLEDIEHATLRALEGDEYGTVAIILKRRLYERSGSPEQ